MSTITEEETVADETFSPSGEIQDDSQIPEVLRQREDEFLLDGYRIASEYISERESQSAPTRDLIEHFAGKSWSRDSAICAILSLERMRALRPNRDYTGLQIA